MSNPIEIAKSRPAETAMPICTVFAALIAKLVGVEDTDTILYIALALSFVPAIVTWVVELMKQKSDVNREPDGTTYQPPSPTPTPSKPSTKPPTKSPTKRPRKNSSG